MTDTPMTAAWSWLLRTSWQAALLVMIVAAIHVLLGRWLAPRWRYALWMLVVVRLLMPATPSSPWSVFNLRPAAAERVAIAPAAPAAPVAPAPGVETTTVTVVKTFPDGTFPPQIEASEIASPASAGIPWLRVLMIVWFAGAAAFVARCVIGYVTFARRLRRAPAADESSLRLLDDCRREMGVRTSVRLVPTDAVGGPALFGFFRARLLVPQRLLADLSPEELRYVFLHELAHVRRRDALAAALLAAAQALHWFNPLAWLALARCRAERELACDGLVLSVTGPAARHAYGRTMLRLAEAMSATAQPRTPAGAIGMLHNRSQLRRRIGMVLNFNGAGVRRRWTSLAPLALLFLIASCAMTDKAEKPAADSAPATPRANAESQTAKDLEALARRQVRNGQYDEALVTIDRLHETDPTNEYAVGVRPLVKDKIIPNEQREYRQNIELELTKPPSTEPQGVSAGEAAMRATLERRLPEVKFEAVGFGDVIDFLRDVTGANISVDWDALEAAGIDRKKPVTARLRDIRFGKALDTILADAGGAKVRLGYSAGDGVITVTTRRELRRNTVTRVYDIRDLITIVPDYQPPAANPTTAPATQPADNDAAARDRLVQEIITLIKETIAPDEWTGPEPNKIRELHGQLIVSATSDTHAQLKGLLDQLRETRSIQATVEARFLTLALDQFEPALRDKLRQSFGQAGPGKGLFLSDEETAAILRESQKQKESTIVTAPRVTLFNGQRAYVQVASERAYVSGLTVVKNDKGETRYEPTVSTVSFGVLLDVQATASADRKYVTCTLKPRLTQLEAMDTAPWPGAPEGAKNLTVQVPRVAAQELQTTVTIPDGGTLLLGGFVQSSSGVKPQSAPSTQPVSNLYMLVKPTLIVQRETESK